MERRPARRGHNVVASVDQETCSRHVTTTCKRAPAAIGEKSADKLSVTILADRPLGLRL